MYLGLLKFPHQSRSNTFCRPESEMDTSFICSGDASAGQSVNFLVCRNLHGYFPAHARKSCWHSRYLEEDGDDAKEAAAMHQNDVIAFRIEKDNDDG